MMAWWGMIRRWGIRHVLMAGRGEPVVFAAIKRPQSCKGRGAQNGEAYGGPMLTAYEARCGKARESSKVDIQTIIVKMACHCLCIQLCLPVLAQIRFRPQAQRQRKGARVRVANMGMPSSTARNGPTYLNVTRRSTPSLEAPSRRQKYRAGFTMDSPQESAPKGHTRTRSGVKGK